MQTALATEYEEQRGKPTPSKNHGIVQSNLIIALGPFRNEFTIVSELSLELEGRPFVPDISVFPKLSIDWHNDEATLSDPPSLVIEILSPSNPKHDRDLKKQLYLRVGVPEYWIVDPMNEAIEQYLLTNGKYVLQDVGEPIKLTIIDDVVVDTTGLWKA